MSYHCKCFKNFEKEKKLQITFNVVLSLNAGEGFTKKTTYQDPIHCPFCGQRLINETNGRKKK